MLVEGLALDLSNLELKSGGLAGAIGASEGTGTPGGTTVDLSQVGELSEGGLVAQRNVEETVVSEGAQRGDSSGLLTTTEGTGGDEDTGVLAPEATSGPDAASLVPEGLPLSREVTETGGDTEEDGIVLEELGRLSDGVALLGSSVELGQDVLGESLLNPRSYLVSFECLNGGG